MSDDNDFSSENVAMVIWVVSLLVACWILGAICTSSGDRHMVELWWSGKPAAVLAIVWLGGLFAYVASRAGYIE